MRQHQLKLFWFLYLLMGLLTMAHAACESVAGGEVVELPISLSFADGFYQQGWVYKSLEPQLITTNKARVQPSSSSSEPDSDGSITMQLEFCFPRNETTENGLTLLLGRMTKAIAKLDDLPGVEISTDTGIIIRLNELKFMLPNPDWILVESAEFLQGSSKDKIKLDIELFNATTIPANSGLTLILMGSVRRCGVGAIQSKPINVAVKIQNSEIFAVGDDPEVTDENEYPIAFQEPACDEREQLEIPLGKTYEIKAGESGRTRFIVNISDINTIATRSQESLRSREALLELLTEFVEQPQSIDFYVLFSSELVRPTQLELVNIW
jgi:hypothetical protein